MKLSALSRPTANPVAVKELRGRMRGARAFVLVSLYQLLLGGIAILVYGLWWSQLQSYGYYYRAPDPAEAGELLFLVSVGFQLVAVTLLAPAFTAGSITGERQKQTFDLLRTTLLPARSIVGGKLFSALIFLLMLELTSLPVISLAFLLGGVTLLEVSIALLLLVVTAISFCTQGLFVSTLTRTTQASTVISYVILVLMIIVLPIVLGLSWSLVDSAHWQFQNSGTASWTGYNIAFYIFGFLACTNPVAAGGLTVAVLEGRDTGLFFKADPGAGPDVWVVTPWLVYVIYHLLLTVLLVKLSIRFVQRKGKR